MNKILIIQTAFIGDVILSTAVIEKWARFYPQAEIHFLLRKGNEGLLENNPHVNKVLIWDKNRSKYAHLLQIIREVRKAKYDFVVNLHRFSSSGLITRYSKARNKIGFDKNPMSRHFHEVVTHKIGSKDDSIYPHEVDRCLKLIEMQTDDSTERPKLYPSEEDFDAVKLLAKGKYVCLSPASVWFTKQFPKHKWVELINKLTDYKVYLLGGPGDRHLCVDLANQVEHEKLEVLAGDLTLLQSAALMSKMNFVNDSAPMHLCSAMNAPVTAIYCSTIKEFGFGPLSDRSIVVETPEELPCRPCGLHGHKSCPEGHFRCAENIDVSELVC